MQEKRRHAFDGEAVVLCADGIPDFNALHSRPHDGRRSALNGFIRSNTTDTT
jgi:ATP-dependent DNA ligase